ncbi:MAG: hypothetical protein PHV57_04030 [Methanomicrobiaceae archaeon]|nr:hypothetical protein [Methanomicrobiaceae archaeon]
MPEIATRATTQATLPEALFREAIVTGRPPGRYSRADTALMNAIP